MFVYILCTPLKLDCGRTSVHVRVSISHTNFDVGRAAPPLIFAPSTRSRLQFVVSSNQYFSVAGMKRPGMITRLNYQLLTSNDQARDFFASYKEALLQR